MANKKDYNYRKTKQGRLTEYEAHGTPISKVDWDVEGGLVHSDPLHDEGSGTPIIMRSFVFTFRPDLQGLPTKEQILTKDYIRRLKTQLWFDELELIADPRVVINKAGCTVFATCQAKKGSFLPYQARPQTLQEITNDPKGNK